jgi:hypothetical protein
MDIAAAKEVLTDDGKFSSVKRFPLSTVLYLTFSEMLQNFYIFS